MREGLAAVISVKMADPQFEGQTKAKLGNAEVDGLVVTAVDQKLAEFFEENPADAKPIRPRPCGVEAREAARKARELTRRKWRWKISLPGKLADCRAA